MISFCQLCRSNVKYESLELMEFTFITEKMIVDDIMTNLSKCLLDIILRRTSFKAEHCIRRPRSFLIDHIGR